MPELNVGGHLSLGKNPHETVRWAGENGFGSMQIFASSPGAWKPPIVDDAAAADFIAARRTYGIDPLIIHAIYLINLGSADETLVRRSASSLVATLRAGKALGAATVVTHIGSHGGRGFDAVVDQIASNLQGILASTEGGPDLALENSAGAGGLIGADLHELGEMIARAGDHRRLKVILDTAHLCGAGWDFTGDDNAERLAEQVEREIGLERLAAIHANDSAQPPGSRRDRHANIGAGHIGEEGFRHLLAQPSFRGVPWILETPELDRRVADRETLTALLPEPVTSGGAYGA